MSVLRYHTVKFLGLFLLAPSLLLSQDVQPRVYAPAPVGINLLTIGYAYSDGAMLFDKTVPIADANANIHSLTVAYSRSTALFGMTGRFDAAMPLVTGNWEGELLGGMESTSRTGIGDPVLRYSLFLSGAPALTPEEFAGFQPKTIVGFTMRIQVPLGQYDPDRLINLGSNRWVFSPQLGIWHVVGKFTFEAYSGVWFFTNNNEFLGTQVRSQEPLFSFQIHTSYTFQNGVWIAVSSRQSLGGAVKAEGGDRLDPETNNRIGLSISLPIMSKYTLKIVGTTGTTTTVGNDYDTLALAWQVIF